MSLSKLSAKCQACPFVDTCGHKRMEEVGYLIPSVPVEQPTHEPSMDILQSSMTVDQIIRAAQQPFEESIRAYLSMLEKGILTTKEVKEMRNLK